MNADNPLRSGKGTCQVCGNAIHLRRHTCVVAWHGPGSKGQGVRRQPCAGTGQLPVELVPTQLDVPTVEALSEILATASSRHIAQTIAALREQLGDDAADTLVDAAMDLID